MDAIETRPDPEARLREAELRLRGAWQAAMNGGPDECQTLVEAAQECRLARLAMRGRDRVLRPDVKPRSWAAIQKDVARV